MLVDLNMDHRFHLSIDRGFFVLTDPQDTASLIPFHTYHRVHDDMNGGVKLVKGRRNGIDQKRHIVIYDLNNGMIGIPAVISSTRIEDPYRRLTRCTFLH